MIGPDHTAYALGDNVPSRGLGDTIHKGLTKVGITKEKVKRVLGDCNCDKRIEALNKLIPYNER